LVSVFSDDGELTSLDLNGTEKWHQSLKALTPDYACARFIADGDILVIAANGILQKYSAANGTRKAELKISTEPIQAMELSPSGKHAFVLTNEGQISLIDVEKLAVLKTITVGDSHNAICAIDDELCCVGSNQIDCWSLTKGSKLWSIDLFDFP